MRIFGIIWHAPLLAMSACYAASLWLVPYGIETVLWGFGDLPGSVVIEFSLLFAALGLATTWALGLFSRRQRASIAGLSTIGQLVQVGPPEAFIAAKKTGTNTFVAYTMICTHEQCSTVLRSNRFECDCHGSVFDNNGHVTVGPANRDLPIIATSYDAVTDTLTIG
jgi:nitrite reductase/ring-hydroxylating ferredoxin subunit